MRLYRGDYEGGRRTISLGEAHDTVRRKGINVTPFQIHEFRNTISPSLGTIVQVVDCGTLVFNF